MARSEGAEGPAQHLAAAIAAAFARAEQPGEHLAVHAPKLAVKPRLQILRRHRRSLLLRLEHPHRPAVEDHVNRASRLGLHRSIILRIGINPDEWEFPPKPKWMRSKTYKKYEERFDRYEEILDY